MDRIIRAIGRRRITLGVEGPNLRLTLWLGDPPGGKILAAPVLEPEERDKLLLALTEIKAHE